MTNGVFEIAIEAVSAQVVLIDQQVSTFGADVSGQVFASAQCKLTGPIVAQLHPHLHDRANQEAAWQAVVTVSGVDLPYPASLSTVS